MGPFGARANTSREKTAIKSPYLNIINEITVLTACTANSVITDWQFASLIAVVNTNRYRRYLICSVPFFFYGSAESPVAFAHSYNSPWEQFNSSETDRLTGNYVILLYRFNTVIDN